MSDNQVEIGILERRRIEAEIIKPIYEIMKRDFGVEKAKAVIEEAITAAAINAGEYFAKKEPQGANMKSFIALQYLWEKDDALEVDVLESNDEQYHYNVKRCRYAEMYQELGLSEIGFLLSCNRDSKFIEGYAQNVELKRPHTIMSGNGFCDFRYDVKKESNQKEK